MLERLGLPRSWGQIELPDPEGEALQGFTPEKDGWRAFAEEARNCLIDGLVFVAIYLEASARETELPPGWKHDGNRNWPTAPVRNVAELRAHLEGLLDKFQNDGPQTDKHPYLIRELRNTRRALRAFICNVANRPKVNDSPSDADEAEREIERLIDLLAPAPVEANIENDTGEIQAYLTEAKCPPKRPGKPRTIDPEEQKIVSEWESRKYKTIHDLVEGMQLQKLGNTTPRRRAQLAIERNRKRSQRAKEKGRTKPSVKR